MFGIGKNLLRRSSLATSSMVLLLFGCPNKERLLHRHLTQSSFKYETKQVDYTGDSLKFIGLFRQLIVQNEEPYHGDKYDENTIIYIDSIIYSPNMQYAAIFVIMKCYNGSMRYRYDMDPDGWHFDGTTHFAQKKMELVNNKYDWILYNAHGTDYILGDTYNKISSILHQENFSGRNYSGKKSKIERYNIDDYRFWESEDFVRIQKSGFKCPLSSSSMTRM